MGTKEGAKKGREKGKRWERQFAQELSLWWSEGKDENIFRRSIGSRVVVEADSQAEDIVSVKESGFSLTRYINFELKDYKEINLWRNLLDGEDSQIFNWFYKNHNKILDKEGILIIKNTGNRRLSPLLIILKESLNRFSVYENIMFERSFEWTVSMETGYIWSLLLIPWVDWKEIIDPRIFELFLRK